MKPASLWSKPTARRCRKHAGLTGWLAQCRLNSVTVALRGVEPDDAARFALLKLSGQKAGAAAARLPELLAMAG